MKIEVNTIVEDNTRRADYNGSYTLIEDKGNTMIIEVETDLSEIENKLQTSLMANRKLVDKADLSNVELLELIDIFEDYQVGKPYLKDAKFQYEDKLYKVIQAHTSQLDWKPDTTKALYLEIQAEGVIGVFKQPTGAHDAYNIGDKVHFPTLKDAVYESKINANTYSPTAYPQGWTKL